LIIQEQSNLSLKQLISIEDIPFSKLHALANICLSDSLVEAAYDKKRLYFKDELTYSPKVFIPLTFLCRDVCHYCTFAQTPKKVESPYLSIDQVISVAKEGEVNGCYEALFTLGDKPELRYKAAREWLKLNGYKTTNEYLGACAEAVLKETSLIPHLNSGCLTPDEITKLKPMSGSMGLMIESLSIKLTEKGQPHYGSPDKDPLFRIQTLEEAGRQKVPFTTGILIGIGETRLNRLESLYEIAEIHKKYNHIQEVIVQNFKAKPNTLMSNAIEPSFDELMWTIAMARLILPGDISLQVPPNLNSENIKQLTLSGINDFGGISPVTKDYVNPEAPWPEIEKLDKIASYSNQSLKPRATLYPKYFSELKSFSSPLIASKLLHITDAQSLIRSDKWKSGVSKDIPLYGHGTFNSDIRKTITDVEINPTVENIQKLLESSNRDFKYIIDYANNKKHEIYGSDITFVVNRNINYTNICSFKCNFCAFSKGRAHDDLRGKPYNISNEEIVRRMQEAIYRGATEVCLQGGIHPQYSGQTYLELVKSIRSVSNSVHIHAFSPLEIDHGRKTLNISAKEFLLELKNAGLNSLPGTAAEILHDDIRSIICPDKLTSDQWIEIIKTAHHIGLPTTSTMMFGHVENMSHVAHHLLKLHSLQLDTNGLTEFVPLPFVAEEAPIFRRGMARPGPTFKETILVHSVARILFHGNINNIQGSWVKMGLPGLKFLLTAGINDIGGVLMNESITRSAGASFGQELPLDEVLKITEELGLNLKQRNTLYQSVQSNLQDLIKSQLIPLLPILNEYHQPKNIINAL
jgi:FO synthase